MTDYEHGLFVFRRDLRLEDNTGLIRALESCERVSTVFILDPRQADRSRNDHFSKNAFAFMVESLIELSDELSKRGGRLAVLEGEASEAISELIEREGFDAVFVNEDYTPFAIERDARIRDACEQKHVEFLASHDTMLNPPDSVLTNADSAYKVFTPYHRSARERPVQTPRANDHRNYTMLDTGENAEDIEVPKASPERSIIGGRSNALEVLEGIGGFSAYKDERDHPSVHGTTRLSAHLKFGTISARELHHAIVSKLGAGHELDRQLYWRDFYLQLLYHYPVNLGKNFDDAYSAGISWNEPGEAFDAWKAGRTGFPIVDAGMRELIQTGWMHNRVRMIVASFLTKDLHIDWREGERWFARSLVDYDPASNNGGWQWAASTGADAAPYFRIFNPWTQQKRFDPEAAYVKRWVPELRELDASAIHNLDSQRPLEIDYPEPIVDHKAEREEALSRYTQARNNA